MAVHCVIKHFRHPICLLLFDKVRSIEPIDYLDAVPTLNMDSVSN